MTSGPEDLNSIKLVEALVSMATILGLSIVAEGIETEFQLSVINNHKLNRAQGYLFKKTNHGFKY